uniref:Initiation-specific alpha-1,6-mannosyltransferase n=1 Tax=Odontella aurita TaxID=265563 RepID=A0A7S4MZD0_9STRA|mmetsp:Transcript_40305/g.121401  ORF Transcript_40305/g.121401 Transcript_40305/m.121401 type:complete len:344 (+) Transcript_40305:452-1483(+)
MDAVSSKMMRRQRQSKDHTTLPVVEAAISSQKKASFLPGSNDIPPVRRIGVCLKFAMRLVVVVGAILVFGTIYSTLTARDPCSVLGTSIRQSPPSMPKLFHYQSKVDAQTKETATWKTFLEMNSMRQTYPDIKPALLDAWTEVYWSDESCLKLVRDHFPDFAPTYEGFVHNIQRVDSCRYLILSRFGGIYADTDISLHSNQIERLIPDGIGLVESPFRYNENVQNSLMTATSPGHQFWDLVIDLIKERGGSDVVLSTTGPKMLDDATEHYWSKGGSGVQRLPCELFQRLPSGQWDTTFSNILGRDVLARAVPMRGCGQYGDNMCEITRHVGKASWTVVSGQMM